MVDVKVQLATTFVKFYYFTFFVLTELLLKGYEKMVAMPLCVALLPIGSVPTAEKKEGIFEPRKYRYQFLHPAFAQF